MLKKIIISFVLALAVFAAATAGNVGATPLELSVEEEALLNKEPPLTQKEIETFIEIAPKLMAAGESPDENAIMRVTAPLGWTKVRTVYIGAKVGLGYAMLTDPEQTLLLLENGLLPESYFPTEEEFELLKQYAGPLNELYGM